MDNSSNLNLKIEHPPLTLREMALERMRVAIIAGKFASGARLVERPLCEQLGVSRSVVREVIRYLEAEGLVETIPNKGPIVARMDWEQARQIYDVRLLLEAKAAETCARIADKADKARLGVAFDQLREAYSSGDGIRLFDATTLFYQIIFDISGQNVAWEIVQRLNGRISRLRAMTLGTTDRHVAGFARMKMIYQAIINNDPTSAAKAVKTHIREAAKIAEKLLVDKHTGP